MSCLHVAKLNPVLLLLRWAGSPPPMWKRKTDFAQRTASAQRPFKADRLQRPQLFSASCKLVHLIKPQKLWLKWKRQCSPPILPSDGLRADVNSHVTGASRHFSSTPEDAPGSAVPRKFPSPSCPCAFFSTNPASIVSDLGWVSLCFGSMKKLTVLMKQHAAVLEKTQEWSTKWICGTVVETSALFFYLWIDACDI